LASFSFGGIAEGETSISKVTLPLPEFPLAKLQGESNYRFLARVELGVENVVGRYGHTKHEAYVKAMSNGGRLNQGLEKAGVPYGPCSELGTEASVEATKKRKVDGCTRAVGENHREENYGFCVETFYNAEASCSVESC
jgi:hypothetical protein